MPYYDFIWTEEIVDHLAEHGIHKVDFEYAVSNPVRVDVSRSTGRPCCWGHAQDGRLLFCVYEYLDDLTIIPVTAYEDSE
jgi:hypothetical protein